MSALPVTQLCPLDTGQPKATNIYTTASCVPFGAYGAILA